MLPTLKATYDTHRGQILEVIIADPQLLAEALDEKRLDEIGRALAKLKQLLDKPEFKELSTLRFGLQKAHRELRSMLSHGSLRKFAHARLPQTLTSLGKLNSFTVGMIRTLRQMPRIVEIVRGGMDTGVTDKNMGRTQEKWDPDKPLAHMLDAASHDSIETLLKKAMTPRVGRLEFVWSETSGLPYVDNDEAIAEILSLSFNQLLALEKTARNTPEEPQPAAAPTEEPEATLDVPSQHEEEPAQPAVIPPKPGPRTGTPQERVIEPLKPLAAANKIDQLFVQSFKEIYGKTHRWTKNDKDFKSDLVKLMVMWLAQQGYVSIRRRTPETPTVTGGG